jgi:hypothetical protein
MVATPFPFFDRLQKGVAKTQKPESDNFQAQVNIFLALIFRT